MATSGPSGGSSERVEVEFGAQISELVSKFGEVGKAFEGLQATFLKVSAVLAGGAAFKEAIEHTEELIDATRRLMNQTGMAADEAQAWTAALKQSDASAEVFASTLMRLQMRLNTNEAAFRMYGIQTRDASGKLLDAQTIFRNTIEHLESMKAGADRNAASIQLLGRSARDVEPFMRAMRVNLEEIRERQAALGLVITEGSIAIKDQYTDSLVKVKEVFTAVEKVIGEGLMPILMKLGEEFARLGPAIVEGVGEGFRFFLDVLIDAKDLVVMLWDTMVSGFSEIYKVIMDVFGLDSASMTGMQFFKNVLAVLRIAILGFKETFLIAFDGINLAAEEFALVIATVSSALDAFFSAPLGHKMEAMKSQLEHGLAEQELLWQKHVDNVAKILSDGAKETKRLLLGEPEENLDHNRFADRTARPVSGSGTAKEDPNKAKERARAIAEFERSQLEATASIEKALNQSSLAENEDNYRQRISDIENYYDIKKSLLLADNAIERQSLIEQGKALGKQAAGSTTEAERLKYLSQIEVISGKIGVLDAKDAEIAHQITRERRDALKAQEDRLASTDADIKQAQGQAEIENTRRILEEERELRVIDGQQQLADEAVLENQRYALQLERLRLARSQILAGDLVAQREQDKKEEEARLAHEQKLANISLQVRRESRRQLMTMFNDMQSGFESVFAGIGTRIRTVTQLIRGLLQAVAQSVISMLARIAAEWLTTQIMLRVEDAATAAAAIEVSSAKAGAAGTASFAGAPWPIDVGAPAFGAQMALIAGSYAAMIPAAAGGWWQLPSDTLMLGHKDEMVLPPDISQGMREMVSQGGGRGDVHLHVSAVDADSVARLFRNNGDALVDVLKRQRRNFAF